MRKEQILPTLIKSQLSATYKTFIQGSSSLTSSPI